MTIQDQTKIGVATSIAAGSSITSGSGKGQRIVRAPLNKTWSKKNAFALGENLILGIIGCSLWVAAAVGLLYWSESSDTGWMAWVGLFMLAVSCLFPITLAAMFIRSANAAMLIRVYKPLSKEWLRAADSYKNPNSRTVKYVLGYIICLPFLLTNDLARLIRFAFHKLTGKNVRFATSRDLFNLRLINSITNAVESLGPDKADYRHYLTWVTLEIPVEARNPPTYQDWKTGIRDQVLGDMKHKYGSSLKS